MTTTKTMLERVRSILAGDVEKGAAALNAEANNEEGPMATDADRTAAMWFAGMKVSDFVALAQLELMDRLTAAVESMEVNGGQSGSVAPHLQPLPMVCPECGAPPRVSFDVAAEGVVMDVGCARYEDHNPRSQQVIEDGVPDWTAEWNALVMRWKDEFGGDA